MDSLNAPSAAYAAFSALFHWDDFSSYIGGQSPDIAPSNLIQQAKGPFLNPVEMAIPNPWSVMGGKRKTKNTGNCFGKFIV